MLSDERVKDIAQNKESLLTRGDFTDEEIQAGFDELLFRREQDEVVEWAAHQPCQASIPAWRRGDPKAKPCGSCPPCLARTLQAKRKEKL